MELKYRFVSALLLDTGLLEETNAAYNGLACVHIQQDPTQKHAKYTNTCQNQFTIIGIFGPGCFL